MPAFLASLLPLLLRLGGGFGAQKLAGMAGSRLAQSAVPTLAKAGGLLQSNPAGLGAFLGGDMATGAILDQLMGGQEPQTDEDGFNRLLTGQSGADGMTSFDRMVKERQLRGTLAQALEQSGVDLNRLSGVL